MLIREIVKDFKQGDDLYILFRRWQQTYCKVKSVDLENKIVLVDIYLRSTSQLKPEIGVNPTLNVKLPWHETAKNIYGKIDNNDLRIMREYFQVLDKMDTRKNNGFPSTKSTMVRPTLPKS